MIALKVRDLTKRFGSFTAVDAVNFDVRTGEIFGFLGANGAGKSTTIRMLCGILPPTSGSAELLGIDVIKYPGRVKKSIGYMSQKFSLYDDLTVKENIEFFAGIHGVGGASLKKRMDEILDLSELHGRENRITGSLPGGWKQKLALGCSLMHDPGVIFLDEPTAGVDPAARRLFWDIINTLKRNGTTIFVTSHYMDEVEQCDRVAMMHNGRIAALNTPASLKEKILPGPVLEIRCENPSAARNILGEHKSVVRVDPFGRGLHAIVKRKGRGKITSQLTDIRNLLRSGCPGKVEVEEVRPGLEDVFVYLIGSLEANHDA